MSRGSRETISTSQSALAPLTLAKTWECHWWSTARGLTYTIKARSTRQASRSGKVARSWTQRSHFSSTSTTIRALSRILTRRWNCSRNIKRLWQSITIIRDSWVTWKSSWTWTTTLRLRMARAWIRATQACPQPASTHRKNLQSKSWSTSENKRRIFWKICEIIVESKTNQKRYERSHTNQSDTDLLQI